MAYEMHRISVLVVEDNQPMLDITKSLLLTFGVGHVIGAKDGITGFKRYTEYNPDIVIADWMMRPVDGIELTRRIRTDKLSPNPFVPLILMTGFSERRRVIEARDAGVTEFLVKPFTARDLYKRMVQIIERPRQFVRADGFFGPDRRRKKTPGYDGPFKREADMLDEEIRTRINAQKLKAQNELEDIRKHYGLDKGEGFNIPRAEIIESPKPKEAFLIDPDAHSPDDEWLGYNTSYKDS